MVMMHASNSTRVHASWGETATEACVAYIESCLKQAADLPRLLGIAIRRSSLVSDSDGSTLLWMRVDVDVLKASATLFKASAEALTTGASAGACSFGLKDEVHSRVSNTPATKQHPGTASL